MEYLGDLEHIATTGKGSKRSDALKQLVKIQRLFEKYVLGQHLDPQLELKELSRTPGLWEFKAGTARLLLYIQTDHPDVPAARLTNGFQKAWPNEHPRRLVNFAKKIADEDRSS